MSEIVENGDTGQPQQSTILSETEVDAVLNETPQQEEEQKLPSEQDEGGDLLLGKFKSQEDLVTAYKELEKKLGKGTEDTPDEETSKEEKKTPDVDPEYMEWKAQKQQKELLEPVGGLDTYKQAVDWAKENLPKEDLVKYNNAIDAAKGNPDIVQTLAKSLIDRYSSGKVDTPSQPLHSGETTKRAATKGYSTKSEMLKDMNDPRYERDEGYRQQVASKIANTNEADWYSTLPKY